VPAGDRFWLGTNEAPTVHKLGEYFRPAVAAHPEDDEARWVLIALAVYHCSNDENLLGVPVADLRQSAIQRLIQALGCDGLQLAAHTNLSIPTIQGYLKLFGQPAPGKADEARQDQQTG
jgi:hypothetical protein